MGFVKGETPPFKFKCDQGHRHQFEHTVKNCWWCKKKDVPRNQPGKSFLYGHIRHLHEKELIPIENNIRRDWQSQQGKLFKGDVEITSRSGIKMGNFYETMTACLFGGRIVKSPAEIGTRANGNPREVVPDIICDERKHLIESKACRQRSHLNLYDNQVKGYMTASKIKGYKARFAIWRHGFQGIHKYKGSLIDLYNGIANCTYAGLILPLKLVTDLWEHEQFKKYHRPDHLGSLTALRSKFINHLIIDPVTALTDINLDHREYIIERWLSPKELMIENAPVPQFPLLIIRNVVPDIWTTGEAPF